uniref:NADH-ubiquinone oxidoreductase chain 2 n=1 Tax=Odontoglaja guamensis TaxID=259595 RepID=E6Y1B8_9GAST|nr:NADH dehydrogenase subunit 2 [Odontoglaja guamensis]
MSSGLLYVFLVFIGPMLTFMSSSWIMAWIGIEISFLGFLPIMLSSKMNSLSKEGTLKYFCIQAFSSALLFIFGLWVYVEESTLPMSALILALSIKLGVFPGHFWVPGISSMMSWGANLLLLSWQKLAPLFLLYMLFVKSDSNHVLIFFLGTSSALVGSLAGNNVQDVKAMMGASSVSHMGWVLFGLMYGGLTEYFIFYSIVLGVTFLLLAKNNIWASVSILSLSGLPPFLLFIGKWNIVMLLAYSNGGKEMVFLSILVSSAIISLFFYLKFFYQYYYKEFKYNNFHLFLLFYVFFNFIAVFHLMIY